MYTGVTWEVVFFPCLSPITFNCCSSSCVACTTRARAVSPSRAGAASSAGGIKPSISIILKSAVLERKGSASPALAAGVGLQFCFAKCLERDSNLTVLRLLFLCGPKECCLTEWAGAVQHTQVLCKLAEGSKGRQRFGSSEQLSAFILHCSWAPESNGRAAELWCRVQSLGRSDVGHPHPVFSRHVFDGAEEMVPSGEQRPVVPCRIGPSRGQPFRFRPRV